MEDTFPDFYPFIYYNLLYPHIVIGVYGVQCTQEIHPIRVHIHHLECPKQEYPKKTHGHMVGEVQLHTQISI